MDDSSTSFFVPAQLSLIRGSVIDGSVLRDEQASVEVVIDTLNAAIEQSSLLTWTYPLILNGTDSLARQGGDALALAFYPDIVLSGTNSLTIRYADSDISGGGSSFDEESSLRIFRWDDVGGQWSLVGGGVDTAANAVSALITESGTYAAFTTDLTTDVNDGTEPEVVIPERFEVHQNYPNPFNPNTTIEYSLPRRSHVIIEIYNVLGQKVRRLIGSDQPAGAYSVMWDGRDQSGQAVSTGIYLLRLQAGDYEQTRKMLLLK